MARSRAPIGALGGASRFSASSRVGFAAAHRHAIQLVDGRGRSFAEQAAQGAVVGQRADAAKASTAQATLLERHAVAPSTAPSRGPRRARPRRLCTSRRPLRKWVEPPDVPMRRRAGEGPQVDSRHRRRQHAEGHTHVGSLANLLQRPTAGAPTPPLPRHRARQARDRECGTASHDVNERCHSVHQFGLRRGARRQ